MRVIRKHRRCCWVFCDICYGTRTCLFAERDKRIWTFLHSNCLRFQVAVPTVKSVLQKDRGNATAAAVTPDSTSTKHSPVEVWTDADSRQHHAIVTYIKGPKAGAYLEGGRTGARPSKLSKIVATRCHILRLKCTKFNFDWGFAPDPTGGAYRNNWQWHEMMKVWNLASWLSGKSLKLLPTDVRF